MPESFEQGGLTLGVSLARVGVYTPATGTWGTLSRIFSVESFTANDQLISAIARGDNHITGAAALREGAELQVQFSGMNPSTLAILTGKTVGNISDYYYIQAEGGDFMPYFGIALKAPSDDGSTKWVWFPKAKLMQPYPFAQGSYNAFSSPQMTIQCLHEASYGLWVVQTNAADFDIATFPPANIPTL